MRDGHSTSAPASARATRSSPQDSLQALRQPAVDDDVPGCLFPSFWMGGFESACQINTLRCRLDMIALTQHDVQADHDYALLRGMGILAARDGVRWHQLEKSPGRYDFSSLIPLADAADRHGIQVVGPAVVAEVPGDLDLFSVAFVDRFARLCRAVARFFADRSDAVPFYAPINEISFLAWAIGEQPIIHPYAHGRAHEVKQQLVRAVIAGCQAIWDVQPRARFIHTDPIIHVVPPRDRPDLLAKAEIQRTSQWQAWDMIAGRCDPGLGGDPKYLDILGVNYYHSNQWESPELRIPWECTPRDERWVPFHLMLVEAYLRYRRPLLLTETSHFGIGRSWWLRDIAAQLYMARAHGVPLQGACIYPVLDRPDWENPQLWHHSGLWDLLPDQKGFLQRRLCPEYARELRCAQRLLENAHNLASS